jgi:hypothetical protein
MALRLLYLIFSRLLDSLTLLSIGIGIGIQEHMVHKSRGNNRGISTRSAADPPTAVGTGRREGPQSVWGVTQTQPFRWQPPLPDSPVGQARPRPVTEPSHP